MDNTNGYLNSDYKNTINHFKRVHSADIPSAELDLKLYTYAKNAERTFDKSKNVSFNTHLSNHLKKINRDVHNSGSIMKSSEDVGMSINKIRTARDEFYMKNGVEPSNSELSKFIGVPERIIDKHDKMGNVKIIHDDNVGNGMNYVSIKSMLPDLRGEEKKVADTIEKDMPTEEALKYTGMKNTTFYKTRNSLRDRMRKSYLRLNTQDS